MSALTIQIPEVARAMLGVQQRATQVDVEAWAHAAQQIVREHRGVPLSTLTVGAAAQPTIDGAPHGIYFIWHKDRLVYVGSTVSRMFHERLAAHLEGSEKGWFNSCVKVMAAKDYASTTENALQMLLENGSVAFWPIGDIKPYQKAQRRAVRLVENRLRESLQPLNAPKGKFAASEGSIDDEEDAQFEREEHCDEIMTSYGELYAETRADHDALDLAAATEPGEVLFVKCARHWPGADAPAEKRAYHALGNWAISAARANGVGVVAAVVRGSVVGAWQVSAPTKREDGRVRFESHGEIADLAPLAALIAGREKGWTWRYVSASQVAQTPQPRH